MNQHPGPTTIEEAIFVRSLPHEPGIDSPGDGDRILPPGIIKQMVENLIHRIISRHNLQDGAHASRLKMVKIPSNHFSFSVTDGHLAPSSQMFFLSYDLEQPFQ